MYKGKYERLYRSLNRKESKGSRLTLTFKEIEDVLQFKLPVSAYKYPAWWANESEGTHSHSRSWLLSGWKTSEVKLGEKVTFIKY